MNNNLRLVVNNINDKKLEDKYFFEKEESERRQTEFKEKTDNLVKNLELDEILGSSPGTMGARYSQSRRFNSGNA